MKKAISIFLLILMLASNSGVVFATHFCMGSVADISIGFSTEAKACEMADMDGMCEHDDKNHEKGGCSIDPVDCCDDEFVQVSLEASFETPAVQDIQVNTEFLAAFTVVYLNLYDVNSEAKYGFVDYSPPLIQQDYCALFQSFLI